MPTDPGSGDRPFWTFSLDVYSRPGISDACLRLQDQYGCDVNVVLFCCWAASTAVGRLDDQILQAAVAKVDEWQNEVIKPIRDVRRRLEVEFAEVDPKTSAELRAETGAIELHAESVEQNLLEKLIAPEIAARSNSSGPMDDARHNLLAYLKLLGTELNNDALDSVATIVAGCCSSAKS